MSVDILGTSWDQCPSMVQYSFTSTETRRLVRTVTSTLTQLLNYDEASYLLSRDLWYILEHAELLPCTCPTPSWIRNLKQDVVFVWQLSCSRCQKCMLSGIICGFPWHYREADISCCGSSKQIRSRKSRRIALCAFSLHHRVHGPGSVWRQHGGGTSSSSQLHGTPDAVHSFEKNKYGLMLSWRRAWTALSYFNT